jgi:hypothetical protein
MKARVCALSRLSGAREAAKAWPSALAGLCVGAAVGGILGGLVGLGILEVRAREYRRDRDDGGILVSVRANPGTEDEVQNAMTEHKATIYLDTSQWCSRAFPRLTNLRKAFEMLEMPNPTEPGPEPRPPGYPNPEPSPPGPVIDPMREPVRIERIEML